MSRRRAVITGWGVASPLGHGQLAFSEALLAGRSGAGPITGFDASAFACRIAAQVPPYDLRASCPDWGLDGVLGSGDRKLELALLAAHEAVTVAGLRQERPAVDAISLGSGLSSVLPEEVERELAPFITPDGGFAHAEFARQALADARFAARHRPGRATELLGRLLGAPPARQATHFSACAASAHAIAQAARWVRRGQAERVLAGGADSMVHPFGLASFVMLGTLTTRNDAPASASRPFDRERDGFLLGEGGAMLVIESLDAALARGATIYGEVCGSGSSLDAFQVTAPHPEGRGAQLAIERALVDAGLRPAQVGYVNAHGTATRLNDPVELRALRAAFGAHAEACPVSSTKSMHGHLIAAAGALEACAVLVALQHQTVPPTINLDDPDPDCPGELVAHVARPAPIEYALSNSFGFGGQNGCLVFGAYPR